MTWFEKIGVVGAGMMGSEIALMFALSGRPTLLSDQSREAAERAIERLHGVLDRGLPRRFWSEEAAGDARQESLRRGQSRRLSPTAISSSRRCSKTKL